MEHITSFIQTANAGDILTGVSNFIQVNYPSIVACGSTALFLLMFYLYIDKVGQYRTAKQQAKSATERANNTLLAHDVAKRAWEFDSEEYKKSMHDFVSELKKDKAEYEAELTKREHVYEGQMNTLRSEIKVLKDENRKKAINAAIGFSRTARTQQGMPWSDAEPLIETAGKIYKFYGGKP